MDAVRIAIDGPGGAGKSTLAKRLAKDLGFLYIDTGALYRAIAYDMLRAGCEEEAQILERLPSLKISLRQINGEGHVFVGDEDVTDRIRTPKVSMRASVVSAMPQVRAFLLDMQRDTARAQSVVMDGRDIATVVLPDAQVKIFLTATPQKRAERRYLEMRQKGDDSQTYEEVLRDVIERDERDTTRAAAPLRQAHDAVLLDTTEMDLDTAEEALLRICREKLPR